MEALIYIRFSTPKQERGASRERQLELCQEFCARNGWPVREVIEDLGKSAWSGTHLSAGELGRLAERVRSGEIGRDTVLIVEKLDRLSRQETRLTLRWMEDICAAGLTIATVDGARIYDDASLKADLMSVFEILMRAKLAHDESQQKSERVLDRIGRNMERARNTGQIITAKAPGWLVAKSDRSGFDIVEERATLVRQIYEMAAQGKGAGWIAKELNERGVPAWGKWRKATSTPTWEIGAVKMILSQPSVEGDYVPGFSNTSARRTKFKEPIRGYYPRIVDADLVARARAQIEARKTGPRKGGRHTRGVANLFAGVVLCEQCGNRMHLRTSGQPNPNRYWKCNFAARARGCSQKAMFRYEPFERGALDEILHLVLADRYFSSPDQTADLALALAELDKTIIDQNEQIERWVEVLGRLGASPAIEAKLVDAERVVKELASKREDTAKALEVARGSVSPIEHLQRVREVRGALDDRDPDVRQEARLRVHNAIVGLGCTVLCSDDPEDGRQIGLFLPDGLLGCIFDNDGRVVARFDGLEFIEHTHPDVDNTELAALATAKLPQFGDEDVAWVRTNPTTKGWLAAYIERYRKGR